MIELHFSTGGPGLRFVSASAEQIAIAVNHVMSRWKLSQPVGNHPALHLKYQFFIVFSYSFVSGVTMLI